MARFYQVLASVLLVLLPVNGNFTKFWEWLKNHSINPLSTDHLNHMYGNWINNDLFIEETNSRNLTYSLAHNVFSGMNFQEFREHLGLNNNNFHLSEDSYHFMDDYLLTSYLPDSVDWRVKGVVTNVKDQGQCGSCYSFSNTGALEGVYAIKHGNLVSFSEQEIVDCSLLQYAGPNEGCNGGQLGPTMDWIGKVGGLCNEADYPYKSGVSKTVGSCSKGNCKPVDGSKVVSHTNVVPNSDDAMMTALNKQPVSVAIQADQMAFQFYSSGVFTQSCGTDLDHAVLLVGYGSLNGVDHYIMKNSWGPSWGDKGYMYLGRGPQYNDGKGQCGVLMQGVYPNL